MPAAVGTFTLGGQDVAFVYVTGANLVAAAGTYVLSGQDTSFGVGMPAGSGLFSLTGQDSRRLLSMPAAAGAVTTTGTATLTRGLTLYAYGTVASQTGHFLFAPLGSLALGDRGASVQAGTTFAWTGQDIEFVKSSGNLTAASGAFVLTLNDSALRTLVYPSKIRAFPRVARSIRGSSRGGGMAAKSSVGSGVRARAFGG